VIKEYRIGDKIAERDEERRLQEKELPYLVAQLCLEDDEMYILRNELGYI